MLFHIPHTQVKSFWTGLPEKYSGLGSWMECNTKRIFNSSQVNIEVNSEAGLKWIRLTSEKHEWRATRSQREKNKRLYSNSPEHNWWWRYIGPKCYTTKLSNPRLISTTFTHNHHYRRSFHSSGHHADDLPRLRKANTISGDTQMRGKNCYSNRWTLLSNTVWNLIIQHSWNDLE